MGGKRTVFMTGGSRGIGLAIAQRLAAEANVAFMANGHADRGAGHRAHGAAAIEEAGGRAPIVGVRDDEAVAAAVARAADEFGGIDIVEQRLGDRTRRFGELTAKRYDLMLDINVRHLSVLSHAQRWHRTGPRPHPVAADRSGPEVARNSPTRSASTG